MYECELIQHGDKAQFVWEELMSGMTTREQIAQIASRTEADFTVVGLHGAKGEKG